MKLIIIPALAGSELLIEPFLDALSPEIEVIESPCHGKAPLPQVLPSVKRLAEPVICEEKVPWPIVRFIRSL